MKKFGLIGGVGPESTVEYYRLILKRFQEKLNTKDYPEIVINSINMTEMVRYITQAQHDQLADFLAARIRTLEDAGADYGAIASNTPHMVFEKLAERVNIPLISIVEETCKEMQRQQIKKAGLLGTKFTMSGGFYSRVAARYGIELIVPSREDQDFIHKKYVSELIYNRILSETKESLIRIINDLKEKESIEGLILGGTELPLILQQSDFSKVIILDTTTIHVESIVTIMIGD
jgi:aspartate racemase